MILLVKIKISMSVLGIQREDRKSTRVKANIGNPKVNRGCPPLTANHNSVDCLENSFGLSIQNIPRGVYHTGDFNAMLWSCYFWPNKIHNNLVSIMIINFQKRSGLLIFNMRLYSSQFPALLPASHTSQPYCHCIQAGEYSTKDFLGMLLDLMKASVFFEPNCNSTIWITLKFCTSVFHVMYKSWYQSDYRPWDCI